MASLDQKVKASIFNVIALSNLNNTNLNNTNLNNTNLNNTNLNNTNLNISVVNESVADNLVANNLIKKENNVSGHVSLVNSTTTTFNGFPLMNTFKDNTNTQLVDNSNINKHSFLKCTPEAPNNGIVVTTVNELLPKKIDYNQMLINSGIIKAPSSTSVAIDITKYTEQIKRSLQNGTLNLQLDNKKYSVNNSNLIIGQDWTILDIITRKPILTWQSVFEQSYNDLKRINDYLVSIETQGIKWYPLKKDLFKALELLAPENVKVVIIGQDPYPGTDPNGDPVAIGISFGTNRINKIPASLAGVYKVMQKTIPGWQYPSHGDITCWLKQGVLLWNKCLTLNAGESGSHKGLWDEFTTRAIQHLDKVNPNVVYLLWGNHAQEMAKCTTSKNILMSSHPSPQGINHGFAECNHFNEANDILVKQGKIPIDWNVY